MDLGWGNEQASKFVTNVGLVTSNGKNGLDIMAAEWTYYVSWSPALISVHIGGGMTGKATSENIMDTKVFGVSIASTEQNVISSVAGGSSGRDIDKVSLLKELGYNFSAGKETGALLVDGSATKIECRLKEAITLGDHTMFIGEIVSIETDKSKSPLAFSFGKYYSLGEHMHKPDQAVLDRIEALKAKHAKKK